MIVVLRIPLPAPRTLITMRPSSSLHRQLNLEAPTLPEPVSATADDPGSAGGGSGIVPPAASRSSAALEEYPLAFGRGRRAALVCNIELRAPASYQLVPRLLAGGGARIRAIHEATGVKLRIRGRGSRHLEGWRGVEAPCPLALVISAPRGQRQAFREATSLAIEMLREEERIYKYSCRQLGGQRQRPVRLFNFGAIHRHTYGIIRDLVTMFW